MIFTFYCFYDFWKAQKISPGYYPAAIECICIMCIVIYFFFEKFQNLSIIPLYNTKVFWISFGFFLFASGSFFLFLYSQSMINDKDFKSQNVLIFSVISILKNIIICVAFFIDEIKLKERAELILYPNNK